MDTLHPRWNRTYDHRLRDLVQSVGDPEIVAGLDTPRSTAVGWLRGEYKPVVTVNVLDMDSVRLQAEVLKLRRRLQMLAAIVRLLVALLRALDARPDRMRLPKGTAKRRLLRAIDRARETLSRRVALRVLRLLPSRYHQWRQAEWLCELDDRVSCPRSTAARLTVAEVREMKDMVQSQEYRHVPTGRLAILAQRLGRVFAAPATWYKLVCERRWRRPRIRVYPAKPKEGVRATKPNEHWHGDTTVIRLLDGTSVYPHAVIDNYSRKILASSVAEKFESVSTVAILRAAAGR